MPHWLIKAAIHRGISWLPGSQRLNAFFQKYVTRSIRLNEDRFHYRLDLCGKYLAAFDQYYFQTPNEFTAFELGTGWYPIVPIGLYLRGAKTIWCYDIAQHVNEERLASTLAFYKRYADDGRLANVLPGYRSERLDQLLDLSQHHSKQNPADWLPGIGIELRAADASDSGRPDQSVDLVVSTGVLEYIPRDVLFSIFMEFNRIGKPGYIGAHYLSLVDEYAFFDRRLSPLNFLRYTEQQWRWFNSAMAPLNRMRISDYRALCREAGVAIVSEDNMCGQPNDLKRIPLAPKFQSYSEEDLLVYLSVLITRGAS